VVGRYVAVGGAAGEEAIGDAGPEGEAEDDGLGEGVAEVEGDAVVPRPAWPATSAAGRKAFSPSAPSTTPDAEPPAGKA
jgi:hypothetical protein